MRLSTIGLVSTMLLAFALGASASNLITTILAVPVGICWGLAGANGLINLYSKQRQIRRTKQYKQRQPELNRIIILKPHKPEPKILMLPAPEKIAA